MQKRRSSTAVEHEAEELVERVLERLFKEVESQDLSRAELLRRAGLSNSFLLDLQGGRSSLGPLRNLFKLLICMGRDPGEFVRSALAEDRIVAEEVREMGDRVGCVEEGLKGRIITERGLERRRRKEVKNRGQMGPKA